LDGFSRSTKEFSAEIVFEKFLMIWKKSQQSSQISILDFWNFIFSYRNIVIPKKNIENRLLISKYLKLCYWLQCIKYLSTPPPNFVYSMIWIFLANFPKTCKLYDIYSSHTLGHNFLRNSLNGIKWKGRK
jgi:hypothetical protein